MRLRELFEDGRIVEKRYIEDHESITVRDFKINMIFFLTCGVIIN